MSFQSRRMWVAAITAALFVFSAVAHAYGVSAMARDPGMAMPAVASDVASHEDSGSHCPPSDCSKNMLSQLACFAHCATVFGIVAEPVTIPVSVAARRLDAAVLHSLASVHGPPEPPPPKSHV
jgi:hypothetical protein